VGTAIEVLWGPHLAVPAFDRQRIIRQPARQGVLARFFQRSEVDRRLDQRTNRPHRIQSTIESGKTRLATADHGLDFTGFRIGDHHCGFYFVGALTTRQTLEGIAD